MLNRLIDSLFDLFFQSPIRTVFQLRGGFHFHSRLFSFFLFLPCLLWAQSDYETVVEDVIFNSSSRVVIDEKTIRNSKAPDLISLITTQANVTLFNNNFQPPQLFLRGGESSHILILIDGVPSYDVSWAQRTLNLNALDINNVRRIEIIKGGQTVLFGGQALAGVIKIETFASQYRDEKKVSATTALTEYEDYRIGASLEKALSDEEGFKASVRYMDRKNQSPVFDSSVRYDQFNHNIDLNYEKQGSTIIRARGFYFKDKSWNPTTVNVAGSQSIADSDVQRDDEQFGVSTQLIFKELPLKPKLSVYGQKGWRYFYSISQTPNVNARFRSQLQGVLLDTTPLETDTFALLAGASYQREDFFFNDIAGTFNATPRRDEKFQELRGYYAMAKVTPSKDFQMEFGSRQEDVTGFKDQRSYQIGLTLFENTKLEWVTGYRAPSSAQRFGIFPNEDLKPETSQTYSLTQDYKIADKGEVSVTLFETSFDNYIETQRVGFILEYANTKKVKTRGVELAASYLLTEKDTLQMSYAYQEPWDQVRHEQLRRRPKVSGTLRLFHAEEKWTTMLEGTGAGERNDFFGATRKYEFEGYFLVNTSASYRLRDDLSLSLRISNLLDYRPELSIDFYGEGRNAWLTAEYRW